MEFLILLVEVIEDVGIEILCICFNCTPSFTLIFLSILLCYALFIFIFIVENERPENFKILDATVESK